jgi:predicted nucleotide-binding protein
VDREVGDVNPIRATDRRKVFVVYGRDIDAKEALFDFLFRLNLSPLQWEEVISEIPHAAPFVGEILNKAYSLAQAVVVLLTPDDEARLHKGLIEPQDDEYETELTGQPRANVLFEAGMAFGLYRDRTILLQVGRIRPFSDVMGRATVRLTGDRDSDFLQGLQSLMQRLKNAGCSVGNYMPTMRDVHSFQSLKSYERQPARRRGRNRSGLNFGLSDIDFIEFLTWNKGRQLSPSNIEPTREAPSKPPQDWIDQGVLDDAIERQRSSGIRYGEACSLVAFHPDTRESLELDKFGLEVYPDMYYHYVAVQRCLEDEMILQAIRKRVRERPVRDLVAHLPLSVIAANVTIIAEDEVLLMRRSQAVATYPGYWQAGPHETMNWRRTIPGKPAPYLPSGYLHSDEPESPLDLVKRALWEEAGLLPEDYGDSIVFSWFGLYLRDATPYFFAHVRTRLTKEEVEEKIADAESAYETSQSGLEVDWLPLSLRGFSDIVETWRPPNKGVEDSEGRRFLPHAVASLTQLWRVLNIV